ncbi:hypothetical protein [Microcoleus sp.]|uniref:hypothetical protein n=1 Tax=Microcoleus sp. TaxID=44472 RepID=UPI00403EB485
MVRYGGESYAYARCPMPDARCPMPIEHLMLLRKAIGMFDLWSCRGDRLSQLPSLIFPSHRHR